MKVILTCGHPHSAPGSAHAILRDTGLADAQPARRESLSPQSLHDGIFETGELEAAALGLRSQLRPGKIWEEVAVDLFLANIDSACWGWADARTTWVMDFWKDLDARVRFVAVYCSPDFALAQMQRRSAGAAGIPEALGSWTAWNMELLRFHHRNRERCLLVDVEAVVRAPAQFVRRAAEFFGVDLRELPADYRAGSEVLSLAARMPATRAAVGQPETDALFEELESSADLPRERDGALPAPTRGRASPEALPPPASGPVQHAAPPIDAKRADVARLEALNAELLQENELLLVQLLEVQEALERDSTRHQDRAWMARPHAGPSSHETDMREEVDGENWYGAEADGRWAGPNETSSIRIPALADGEYDLRLDVAEAIAPEILPGLEVWFNGRRIEARCSSNTAPAVVCAVVQSDPAANSERWEFRFKFPRMVSPVELGSTDTRRLAMKLRSLRLTRADQDQREEAARADEEPLRHAFAARFWADHQPVEFVIDLRREVDGANWYAAEPAGRWAGPDNESSLRMPALSRGRYELLLDIADSMDSAIVAGMQIALNGVVLETESTPDGRASAIGAAFSTGEIPTAPIWELRLRFPAVVPPATRGSDDPRRLAAQLRSVTVRNLGDVPRADEALRARLEQAQDELRRMRLAHAPQLEAELREEIDGENWHAPETDGRGAGSATSTLRLPALGEGRYEVQLQVLDAVEPGLLAGLELSLNGMPLEVSLGSETCPTVVAARFSTDEIPGSPWWQFEVKVAGRVSPAGARDEDPTLGLTLGSLKLFALGAGRLVAGASWRSGLGGRSLKEVAPRVCVAMPSLNHAAFIAAAARSVLEQDYPDLELVVADGGSADGTLEHLEALQQQFGPRLRWTSAADSGPAEGINRALRAARGELIGWLNSDDLYAPGAVSRAVAAFSSRPDAAMVYGEADNIDAQGGRVGRYPTRPPTASIQGFQRGCFISQPTVFLRRRVFDAVGYLDESLAAVFDMDLWLRVFRRFPDAIVHLPAMQAFARSHAGSITHRMRRQIAREAVEVLARHLGGPSPNWVLGYAEELYATYPFGDAPADLGSHLLQLAGELESCFEPRAFRSLLSRLSNDARFRLARPGAFAGVTRDGWAPPRLALRFAASTGRAPASVALDCMHAWPVWYPLPLTIRPSWGNAYPVTINAPGPFRLEIDLRGSPGDEDRQVLIEARKTIVPRAISARSRDARRLAFQVRDFSVASS